MGNIADIYEYRVKQAINDWGRDVAVIYGSSATCGSCTYDPINKEATNVNCSTCDGLYYYKVETTLNIKGVVKTFIGNMKFMDYALEKHGYIPDHDARLNCWLDDVLIDTDSATGPSYLDADKIIRVQLDAKKYSIKSTYRTGVEQLKVVIATLEEIK